MITKVKGAVLDLEEVEGLTALTLTDADATPSVATASILTTANTSATSITDFDGGVTGQVVLLICADANTTIDFTSSQLRGNGGIDRKLLSGESVLAVANTGATIWYCAVVPSTAAVPQTLTGAGAVDLLTDVTLLVTTGTDALTLADGTENQHKTVIMKTDGGIGTLTPTSLGNGTTIIFDDAGDSADLVFTNSAWHMIGGTATLDSNEINVISSVGATRTLLASESGSICLFDRAAGIVYTLPAPVVGLKFRFVTTVTRTSNSETINTDAGTTFLQGGITQIIDTSATSEGQFGDGSTHVSLAMNGTTTGGIIGTDLTFECVTATQWQVSGIVNSSGTLTTPFA